MQLNNNKKTKCGYVTLAGKTNAGKSSLFNCLINEKISIVTHKAQTTRNSIHVIATKENTQIIFIDTPGKAEVNTKFDNMIEYEAKKSITKADIVLYVKDARKHLSKNEIQEVEKIKNQQKNQIWLVLNKIDLVKKTDLLKIAKQAQDNFNFDKIWMVSAKNNDGVKDLIENIVEKLPESQWLYLEQHENNSSQKFIVAEITREKIMLYLHQELPYAIAVITDDISHVKKSVRISQTIYVDKNTQKNIVIGKKAAMVKHIGITARKAMKQQFKCEVELFLNVKVQQKSWQSKNICQHNMQSNQVSYYQKENC